MKKTNLPSTELQIKEILHSGVSFNEKIDKVCYMMTWNREKLIELLSKNGMGKEGIGHTIKSLWRRR